MYLLSGHAGDVNSVAFSGDDSKVISGSNDKTVKIWNADSGEVIQTLSGKTDKDMYYIVLYLYMCILCIIFSI